MIRVIAAREVLAALLCIAPMHPKNGHGVSYIRTARRSSKINQEINSVHVRCACMHGVHGIREGDVQQYDTAHERSSRSSRRIHAFPLLSYKRDITAAAAAAVDVSM